ncbi:hypothetical protein FA95DRAFT_1563702 [Auriscalpium vulgare]|uniref:Uncharacterized protein n=1 Tax=Auriscalpium vulgare TaxID=40419 RepID=A0ACB8RG02_9AGAM|nr:hypothetical protein FA95DRAFT_1563702 [Auriscalpium vulgare]
MSAFKLESTPAFINSLIPSDLQTPGEHISGHPLARHVTENVPPVRGATRASQHSQASRPDSLHTATVIVNDYLEQHLLDAEGRLHSHIRHPDAAQAIMDRLNEEDHATEDSLVPNEVLDEFLDASLDLQDVRDRGTAAGPMRYAATPAIARRTLYLLFVYDASVQEMLALENENAAALWRMDPDGAFTGRLQSAATFGDILTTFTLIQSRLSGARAILSKRLQLHKGEALRRPRTSRAPRCQVATAIKPSRAASPAQLVPFSAQATAALAILSPRTSYVNPLPAELQPLQEQRAHASPLCLKSKADVPHLTERPGDSLMFPANKFVKNWTTPRKRLSDTTDAIDLSPSTEALSLATRLTRPSPPSSSPPPSVPLHARGPVLFATPHSVMDLHGQPILTTIPVNGDEVAAYLSDEWLTSSDVPYSLAAWETRAPAPAPFIANASTLPAPPLVQLNTLLHVYHWHSMRDHVASTLELRPPHEWESGKAAWWRSRLKGKGASAEVFKGDPRSHPAAEDLARLTNKEGLPWVRLSDEDVRMLLWEVRTFHFRRDFERLVLGRHPSRPLAAGNQAAFVALRARLRRLWGPGLTFFPYASEPRVLDHPDELYARRAWRGIGYLLLEVLPQEQLEAIHFAMGGSVTEMSTILMNAYSISFRSTYNREPITFMGR